MTTTRSVSPPAACAYAELLPAELSTAREAHGGYPHGLRWTERHLQCVWADPALRPCPLFTETAELVEVQDHGRWNLEAGPDFFDAVLLVGPERRRLAGDIEVHVRPSDWTQHRHGGDPRYARVIAHVTYYPGELPPAVLPGHVLRIALRDPLLARPAFSFDDIDLSAYPHAVIPPTPRPCAAALGDDPARWRALLSAAGLHRMEVKRQRLAARLEQTRHAPQALYGEIMAALGYKQNTSAFRRLAQALPLADWPREEPPLTHYARLLGVAGLLPPPAAGADEETCRLLRELWDLWWRHPAPLPDPPIEWHLNAMRPANHPARRLAAAAALCGGPGAIETLWQEIPFEPPAAWYATVRRRLQQRASLDFWRGRVTLTSARGDADTALLGADRAAAIVTNVLVPWLALASPLPEGLLLALPPETVSAPMRATAAHLFGRDHNAALYSGSGLLQQGLLQLFADFCLNARDGCDNCCLAERLKGADRPSPVT